MFLENHIMNYVNEIRDNFTKELGEEENKENVTIDYNCNYDGEIKDNITLRYFYNDNKDMLSLEINTYTYHIFLKEIVALIKDICKQSYNNVAEIKEYFNKLIDTKYIQLANAQLLEKRFFKLNLIDYINLN